MPDEPFLTRIGIDACPGGWACVVHRPNRLPVLEFNECLDSMLEMHSDSIVAIDIPMGLPDEKSGIEPGIRQCDKQARKLLGFPRSTSVFSSPVRPLLTIDCPDIAEAHREASSITMRISDRKVTRQTINILPRIREVDELLQRWNGLGDRIFEVHPELAFMELNGAPIQESKRSAEGHIRRKICLDDVFGSDAVKSCITMIEGTPIKLDDVIDALACCWSADRISRGIHLQVPSEPEFDSTGLPMAINY